MRNRSVLLAGVGVLLLAGALLGITLTGASVRAAGCETVRVLLEPVRPGERSSRILRTVCMDESVEQAIEAVLEPIQPGDEGWDVEPNLPEGDLVNGIVRGPSDESAYRCVVYLEPIQSGAESSKASEPVCSRGPIDSVNGVLLDSSYLVARFYDNTSYENLLIEYYGASPCSSTVSYGVPDLPDNLDNKFASGKAYSNCDHIYVYDHNGYRDPSYVCGANCPTFYALNNAVSSWKVTD